MITHSPPRSWAAETRGYPATIDRALELDLKVKINCVLQRSYLDDAFGVAELAKRLPIAVRPIKLRHIKPAEALFPTEFVPEVEVRERLHT
ncbi:hypothetical protein OHT76_00900 [Streptomyces sp. NBC_00287]|uniref:hypothetical protein n=1 Tax=Streptomyces sp. NBC_00287 TaxID=2975702 RepID=UPI002E2C944C|nr:hypothetical protein [Streptomyces sp. NBC_00287]